MSRTVKIIFFVFFISMSQQTLALVITSPKNGDTFKEGDTVKLVAELSDNDPDIVYVDFDVTKGIDYCPDKISTHPRYECIFTIPPGSPQIISISATGSTVESAITSPWISIKVILPSSVTLQQLKSFTGNTLFFSRVGQNNQIYLEGIYSDRVERDLKSASSGTIYSSSNESIVTVSPDGLVTAKGPGKSQVTGKNNGKTLILDANVEIELEPPASLIITAAETGLQLSWQLSQQDPDWVTDYQIFRTGNMDGLYNEQIAIVPKGTMAYTDKTVQKGKQYYYAVQAISKTAQTLSKFSKWMKGIFQ